MIKLTVSEKTINKWFLVIYAILLVTVSAFNVHAGDPWLVLFNVGAFALAYAFVRWDV